MCAGSVTLMLPVDQFAFPKTDQKQLNANALENDFINPPYSAAPHTWWHWMNGNVTKEGISLDLEAMKRAGLGGFQAFHVTDGIPQGPVNYNSHKWHELMAYAIQKADSLGLEMCFHNCAGWSSSGGPWIDPATSMKIVVWSETNIHGPLNFNDKLKEPESNHDYYRDIAIIAFPTPLSEKNGKEGFRIRNWQNKTGYQRETRYRREDRPEPDTRAISVEDLIPREKIINLTDKLRKNGELNWEVPSGDWTIVRFGYTTTGITNHPAPPEGEGLECDKLCKKGVETHWNNIVERVIQDAGPRKGKSFSGILIDSYETGSQNWTEHFPEEFRQRRGYDIFPYLPCLTGRVVENIEISERFLWDFRRTVADLFAENYYGYVARLCEQNGLKLYVEPYGQSGFFDDFTNAGYAHIPMGEFWVNRYNAWHWWSSKLASSAAHVFGRKYVGSETFTAGGKDAAWINHPYSLKTLGDYFYCKGINRFIFHDYAHQPWADLKPGMTMGPHGFQMNRGNTWWKQSKEWLNYLSRCQYMLQQGLFVADLCYYFGENVPNTLVREEELQPIPPEGYDYDAFSTDALMQLKTDNGKLVLPSGMQYKILILPHFDRTMRPEILLKIRDLVKDGGIVVGPKPEQSPSLSNYPNCDEEVHTLADEIWGNAKDNNKICSFYGKGRVYSGTDLKEVITDLKILPDFTYKGDKNPHVEYIHRQINETDVYFISNQEYRFIDLECTFRITDKIPELWNPQTGEIKEITFYLQDNKVTIVPLMLEPAEAVFIVFRKSSSRHIHATNIQYNNHNLFDGLNKHQPLLNIFQAKYGVLNNPSLTSDVSRQLNDHIKDNQLQIVPCRDITDDPAPDRAKQLYVEYTIGNNKNAVTIDENALLVIPDQPVIPVFPPIDMIQNKQGKIQLNVWQAGKFDIQMSNGIRLTEKVEKVPDPLQLNAPWTVHFPTGWGAPEQTVFDELISWTEHPHTEIKHFSGTATYKKEIHIPSHLINDDHLLWLDLGRVYNIAEVILNNQNMGILWKPPFRVNVTNVVQPGINRLEIRVTNCWPNRLIGDEAKPDIRPFQKNNAGALVPTDWERWLELAEQEQQSHYYTKLTGRYTWTTWKHYKADDSLLESGLLGPVRIYTQVIRKLFG